jgi:tetratricopeptide (TPR) repeat protein
MLPRLTPLQWIVSVAFLLFYGFAVFALTRDYYLRHPPYPARPVANAPHALPEGPRVPAGSGLADESGIPQEVLESNPKLLAQEADRRFGARRFAEAATLYRRVLELAPDDADSRNDLGLALHYAGDTDTGLEVLRSGARDAPDFQRIWLSLGFVAAQAGRFDEAEKALRRALQIDADSEVGLEASRLLKLLPERRDVSEGG